MMYKARCIKTIYPSRKDRYARQNNIYAIKWFEYRGREYFVEYKPFAYISLGDSPKEQHEYEQKKIDQAIEDEEFQQEKTQIVGTVEQALRKFFDYLDGNDDAFED